MGNNKYIKICPKCGSTNITSYTGKYHIGGAEEFKDNCKNCGYQGIIPEIEKGRIKEFRKKLKNNKK